MSRRPFPFLAFFAILQAGGGGGGEGAAAHCRQAARPGSSVGWLHLVWCRVPHELSTPSASTLALAGGRNSSNNTAATLRDGRQRRAAAAAEGAPGWPLS